MIQSPCVPQPMQTLPVQQPSYNAVKIDIHNPQVGIPGNCAPAQCPQSQYQEPTAPIYNYPQAPIYNYPQAPVQPVYCPPVAPQTPGQVNVNYPQQPQVPVTPTAPAQVPEPQISEPPVNEPKVEVPENVQPQVDLNAFIAKLSNPDFNQQVQGMEDISSLIKADEKDGTNRASALVDTKLFNALNNIINFDSSKLEGPTQAQFDARQKILDGKEVTEEEKKLANTFTPKELAERNKSYALFTVAMLDKFYSDEVARLSNSNTVVPLTELPEVTNIVNQLKDNPNPMVRASAIEALSYMQHPEYKKDLTTLFEVAKNDQDQEVAQAAKAALEKLNQV